MLNPPRYFNLGALVFAAILFLGGASIFGYSFTGSGWLAGTIQLQLNLGDENSNLQDGTGSWNGSAADALGIWNQYLDAVQFSWTRNPAGSASPANGINEVCRSNTIYGDSFGSTTLAVTVVWVDSANPSLTREADVIINNANLLNSYRGPLQYNSAQHQYVYDFHRIVLHEFGHVLGLDHPDDHGQSVEAIMNSVISDLDHLVADDIAGVKALYGFRITSGLEPASVMVGTSFNYQIRANNHPTSFGATGLPTGLQLDSTTGLISGSPTVFGTFLVQVTASGGSGSVTATVTIVIQGPLITSPPFYSPGAVGDNFVYQISATNNPQSYDALGLPSGLILDHATGLITGVPTMAGTFDVTLIAHTAVGDATINSLLTVRPPYITSYTYYLSVPIGQDYFYQITANIPATSYGVTGLPSGLQLDPSTGLITGVPSLSGNYNVTVIAHTAYGDVSGTFYLTVLAALTPDTPFATLSVPTARALVADPQRPRIYIATSNGIAVLDTGSLSIIKQIPVLSPTDISMAADGSKLWLIRNDESVIGAVDLETLTVLPDIIMTVRPNQVREGVGGRLYVSAYGNNAWQIYQLNSATGEIQSSFTPSSSPDAFSYYVIEVSPDRKTLFAGAWAQGTLPSAEYDISGPSPILGASLVLGGNGCDSLSVSHDGNRVCLVPHSPSPSPTKEFSGTNLTLLGSFTWTNPPGDIAFNTDDSVAYQASELHPVIGVFNTANFALQRTINLPNTSGASRLVVDNTNTYLVVATNGGQLQIYRIKGKPSNVPPKSLVNVSTRTFVQTGDNVEIGGFIIHGDQSKKVVLRAIGPSLSAYGLPAVSDPVLELHDSTGAVVATNDNWNSHRQDVLNTGYAPNDEHEAVIVTTLAPGNYTAILHGLNGATGTAVFELYDVDPTNSKVANISTRAEVGTGDNVMIGGFIIGGGQPTKVIVRAIGPSLTRFNVSGALQDPTLELHDGSGNIISQNDNWRSDQEQTIIDSHFAPSDDRESAILATLPPGAYTAIVRGKNDTTGVALVEVYNLEAH